MIGFPATCGSMHNARTDLPFGDTFTCFAVHCRVHSVLAASHLFCVYCTYIRESQEGSGASGQLETQPLIRANITVLGGSKSQFNMRSGIAHGR